MVQLQAMYNLQLPPPNLYTNTFLTAKSIFKFNFKSIKKNRLNWFIVL